VLLCCPACWSDLSIDDLAALYDAELLSIADRLVPARNVVCCSRPSDGWFDSDCRCAKRLLRRLERAASAAAKCDDLHLPKQPKWRGCSSAVCIQSLLRTKRESFWHATVESQRNSPRALWSTVNNLLGRGGSASCDDIGAVNFHDFFDKKWLMCAHQHLTRPYFVLGT
jgi:hypothetical protein